MKDYRTLKIFGLLWNRDKQIYGSCFVNKCPNLGDQLEDNDVSTIRCQQVTNGCKNYMVPESG